MIGIIWRFFRRVTTRKRVFRFALITTFIWVGALIWLALSIHTFGQHNNVQQADAIVVLGAGLRRNNTAGDALYRRSAWAAELWSQGIAPYVVCTGGQTPGYSRSEAEGCRDVVVENGVPFSAVILENRSRSTEENAINTQEIMRAQGWDDIVLVTDSFHMMRADWIFNDVGITHYPSPVASNRVRKTWYVASLGREIVAMHWQVFKKLLNLPVTYVPFG